MTSGKCFCISNFGINPDGKKCISERKYMFTLLLTSSYRGTRAGLRERPGWNVVQHPTGQDSVISNPKENENRIMLIGLT